MADYGLSRAISVPVRKYTTNVVTIWYRAPELLLGMNAYSYPLDIWSLGCVFAEMITGNPLFNGDSEIDQIRKIFKLVSQSNQIISFLLVIKSFIYVQRSGITE